MSKESLPIAVVKQNWEESELGWGVRPDGYSLHLNAEDRNSFVTEYWDRMPNETPVEYSRPAGEPRYIPVEITVFNSLKKAQKEGKPGLRFYK